eukprot:m.117924 g.117924  ORF g.117924 m.117924 type:complete len:368 (+) comp9217_c0_seq12:141-1244(+)
MALLGSEQEHEIKERRPAAKNINTSSGEQQQQSLGNRQEDHGRRLCGTHKERTSHPNDHMFTRCRHRRSHVILVRGSSLDSRNSLRAASRAARALGDRPQLGTLVIGAAIRQRPLEAEAAVHQEAQQLGDVGRAARRPQQRARLEPAARLDDARRLVDPGVQHVARGPEADAALELDRLGRVGDAARIDRRDEQRVRRHALAALGQGCGALEDVPGVLGPAKQTGFAAPSVSKDGGQRPAEAVASNIRILAGDDRGGAVDAPGTQHQLSLNDVRGRALVVAAHDVVDGRRQRLAQGVVQRRGREDRLGGRGRLLLQRGGVVVHAQRQLGQAGLAADAPAAREDRLDAREHVGHDDAVGRPVGRALRA